MSVFTHDNIAFHYEILGCGRPIVMCHGLGGDCEQPRQLFGEIPGWQLIVWDCRGHGLTRPLGPDSGFAFPVFADDLRALLGHLNIERAVVGGISMGAATAITFALRWPEMVAGLLLVRPAWLNQPNPSNLDIFPDVAKLLVEFDDADTLRRLEAHPRFRQIEGVSKDCAESVRQQLFKPEARARSVRLRCMPASTPFQNWEELNALKLRSLVIGNSADPVHPLEMARELGSRLPEAIFQEAPSKAYDPQAHARVVRQASVTFCDSLSV